MATDLTWKARLDAGTQLLFENAGSIPTESVETISVTINAATELMVQVDIVIDDADPSNNPEMIAITSNNYENPLEYNLNDTGASLPLDGPVFLIGKGATGTLGSVEKIKFKNDHTEDINLTVVIGSDATPA